MTTTTYRGYTLTIVRHGTPTECVHIRHGNDFLGAVPTMEKAKQVVDDYVMADNGR